MWILGCNSVPQSTQDLFQQFCPQYKMNPSLDPISGPLLHIIGHCRRRCARDQQASYVNSVVISIALTNFQELCELCHRILDFPIFLYYHFCLCITGYCFRRCVRDQQASYPIFNTISAVAYHRPLSWQMRACFCCLRSTICLGCPTGMAQAQSM